MGRKEFTITVNDKQHLVVVNHNYFTGEEKIWINNRLEHQSKNMINLGSVHDFPTGNDVITVAIYPNLIFMYSIDLFINNKSEVTGETVPVIPRSIVPWAYIFILINAAGFFLVPIDKELFGGGVSGASIAGGISGAIIGLTSVYSIGTIKNPYLDTMLRLMICTMATIICYAIFFVLGNPVF